MAVQDAATLKGYFNTGDTPTEAQFADLIDTVDSKQATLVSATNIKTINSTSLLGSGDIVVGGTDIPVQASAPSNPTDGDLWIDSDATPTNSLVSAINWTLPVAVTDTATLTIGKHHVCSGTSADYTATLPAVSGNAGKLISIEIAAACTKLITIDGNGSETIDGATTRVMWASETAILLCNGTTWTKVGGKSIPMIAGGYYANSGVNVTGADMALFSFYKLPLTGQSSMTQTTMMYDATNDYLVVKRPGSYKIKAGIWFNSANSSSKTFQSIVYKSGTGLGGITAISVPGLTYGPCSGGELIFNLSAGDYLELYARYVVGTFDSGDIIIAYADQGEGASFLHVEEIVRW